MITNNDKDLHARIEYGQIWQFIIEVLEQNKNAFGHKTLPNTRNKKGVWNIRSKCFYFCISENEYNKVFDPKDRVSCKIAWQFYVRVGAEMFDK